MAIRSMSLMFQQALGKAPKEEEEPEEEEEEIPAASEWAAEGRRCIVCDDHLNYTEEIVKLEVQVPSVIGGQLIREPFLCDSGAFVGDFYYDPLFFEFDCWESVAESLREMVEDAPPVRSKDELFACDFCECSICENEIYGAAYVGELHVSPRMPNGEVASTFVTIAKPYTLCLGCLILLNTHEVDLWDDDLNQTGECQECSHIRCWRYDAGCSCPCHAEGSEDG